MEAAPRAPEREPSPDLAEFSLGRQVPYLVLAIVLVAMLGAVAIEGDKRDAVGEKPADVLTHEDLEECARQKKRDLREELGEEAYERRELAIGGVVLLGALVSTVLFILLVLGLYNGKRLLPAGEKVPPGWGLIACVKCVLIFIFLGSFLVLFIPGMVKGVAAVSLAAHAAGSLISVLVFLVILRVEYRSRGGELGLTPAGALRGVLGGLLGYVAFALPFFLLATDWDIFAKSVGLTRELNPVLGPLIRERTPALAAAVIVAVCVAAPVAEEFFFRGLLYSALREKMGCVPAALISSALFGIVHEGLYNAVPLFILGLIFAYIYERTRSLAAPVLAHALHNIITIGVFFYLT